MTFKETDSKANMSDFAMQYGVDKSMLSKWVKKIGLKNLNKNGSVQKEEFQNDVKIKQELPDSSEIEPLGRFENLSKITRNLPRFNYREEDIAGSYSIIGAKYLDFSPLVPSKREKNVLVCSVVHFLRDVRLLFNF